MVQILAEKISSSESVGETMDCKAIDEKLRKNDLPFRSDLPGKLEIYLHLLQEWNKRMDLTAVLEEEEMFDKHFADSLTVLRTGLIPDHSTLIDVGTGAGFPGMVLAMARPDLRVTLMDAQKKRLSFLEAVRDATETENVMILHARAEDGAREKKNREQYDIAVARAVAPLNVLCEYLLPYVRTGGCALCWKGPALHRELEAGRRAARILGGRLEMPVPCPVAGRDWEHLILPVRKTEKTASAYPRKAGTPKANPLGEENG